ncbi:DUF4097 family beta strand repeat-containing protein [Neptunicella marina]|uniref:DUF4097 family beta strand repeat protein n=1 Tax=Neptunicella marina TaxID=2125989 RepID=A0A8J6M2A9_9ALTE|nr:DUF4097 family beta strand repeat-containing protein [Neptunicella marina]MBC3766042.1 DUF4097 family beta strand repeat protein [Neptunicella marina]
MKKITALIIAMGLSTSVLAAEQKLQLDADGIQILKAENGMGDLHIHGEDVTEIRAKAIYPDSFDASEIVFKLEKQGDVAYLKTDFGQQHRRHGKVEVEVIVPKSIKLKIADGSGDLCVRTISDDVDIEDGSGDTQLYTVTGDVKIVDGSGDLTVNTVTGNVDLTDSSGDIDVITVTGEVNVTDSSGDINLNTVVGAVTIEDGSGDINVKTATSVYVKRDGSGDRYFDGVGKVELGRGVKHRD